MSDSLQLFAEASLSCIPAQRQHLASIDTTGNIVFACVWCVHKLEGSPSRVRDLIEGVEQLGSQRGGRTGSVQWPRWRTGGGTALPGCSCN